MGWVPLFHEPIAKIARWPSSNLAANELLFCLVVVVKNALLRTRLKVVRAETSHFDRALIDFSKFNFERKSKNGERSSVLEGFL